MSNDILLSSRPRSTGLATTYSTGHGCSCLKKNLNASKPFEQPPSGEKLSKRLGGNIGCRDKSWYKKGFLMLVTYGQQYNIVRKPTVILYAYYIDRPWQGHRNKSKVLHEPTYHEPTYRVTQLLLLFVTFSVLLVANPRDLLYTVANSSRGSKYV